MSTFFNHYKIPKYRLSSIKPTPPRIVPMGPPISNTNELRTTVSNSARRLEVCFYSFF